MNIKFVSLDNIDFENKKVIHKQVNVNDAKDYIENLINSLLVSKKTREFESKPVSYTLEQIESIISSVIITEEIAATKTNSEKNAENNYTAYADNIAKKFLQAQIDAKEKYKQITKIQKGSLIQALVEHENNLIYLACIVEHSTFIDESDLKYRIGLPKSDKATLKSCIIYYSAEGIRDTILVTDSRPKITEYWYDSFLELTPKRDDRTNTTKVYNSIRNMLNTKLSLSYKADCTNLNNTLNVLFSKNGSSFELSECLDFLFKDYTPIDDKLNISDLRTSVESKIKKQTNLDTVFNIDNSDIKSKLNNIKYTITDNIEVKLKTSKTNLNDYIYSDKLEGGEKVLIIRNINDDAYRKFSPSED